MSLAAETRDAVRDRPFLFDALRAGVVNYAAAARAVDVADDTEAVATALRRFEDDLPPVEREDRDARVTMHGGLALTDAGDESLLRVGDRAFADGGGNYTGVLASGQLDVEILERALGLFRAQDVSVEAAGMAGDGLVVVVARRDGATAVRLVERALDAGPRV